MKFPKLIQRVGQGLMLPPFHGVAWRDYSRNEAVTMPIPFNLVASLLRSVWLWAKAGGRQVSMEPRDAYLQGKEEGKAEVAIIFKFDDAVIRDSLNLVYGSKAIADVLHERIRQRTVEGYSNDHDDEHDAGELAAAAICYAGNAEGNGCIAFEPGTCVPRAWPWATEWWRPSDPRRDLVKAGALIIAEIERIDRITARDLEHQKLETQHLGDPQGKTGIYAKGEQA